MSPRQKVPIPYGEGLERGVGPQVADSKMGEDIRNAFLANGYAHLRGGMPDVATFENPDDASAMTSVIAGEYFKSLGVGIVAAWQESTGEVRLYRVQRDGTAPTHLGLWFTLGAGADSPPKVWLAELAGSMFAAHDESALSRRAVTIAYSPTGGGLLPLTAPWAHATVVDPGGAENAIRYSHVAAVDVVVTVTYLDPGLPGQPLAVAVVGSDIGVSLATDGGGLITSTAADVVAAIQASAEASALVSVAVSIDDGGLGDGTGIVGPIGPVTIDVDGIRFRGVAAHLGAYLAGWGYGTYSEARPDLVRMSMPGQPMVFQLQHYESIGQVGDPVLACFSVGGDIGGTLLCLKGEELWDHFGSDRRTFGKRQLDSVTGILAAHLGVVVDVDGQGQRLLFFWSAAGPRATEGALPVDLAIPLELLQPAPADLLPEGDSAQAFACYVPVRRQVRFHFDQRYYAYDVSLKRWSYGETSRAPSCGFLLPTSGAGLVVDPGVVDGLVVTEDIETP